MGGRGGEVDQQARRAGAGGRLGRRAEHLARAVEHRDGVDHPVRADDGQRRVPLQPAVDTAPMARRAAVSAGRFQTSPGGRVLENDGRFYICYPQEWADARVEELEARYGLHREDRAEQDPTVRFYRERDAQQALLLAEDAAPVAPSPQPWVALLPSLDPTPMGWKEREWYVGSHTAELFDTSGNIGPTVWSDGRIVGVWGQPPSAEVVPVLLEDVPKSTAKAIAVAAEALTAWLDGVRITPRFRTPAERGIAESEAEAKRVIETARIEAATHGHRRWCDSGSFSTRSMWRRALSVAGSPSKYKSSLMTSSVGRAQRSRFGGLERWREPAGSSIAL